MTSTFRRQWGGPALLILIFAVMAAWTWTRSGDPLLDSAKDLYTAQQMSQGRALYGELCYLFGPLAPSILAVAFTMFGASVNVERTLNLILFVPVVLILYRLLVRLSDRFAGTVTCAIYLVLFAFGHLTPLRNYNILTPYTNSATYGFALGIVTVAALVKYARDGGIRWPAIAGAACGLSFLTKPESFLGCAASLVAGLAIASYARREAWRVAGRAGGVALGAFILAPMLLVVPLAIQSSWAEVGLGVLAGYRMSLDPRVQAMRFQLEGAGFWFFRRSLETTGSWVCAYGWILLPPLLLSFLPKRFRGLQLGISIAGALTLFYIVWFLPNDAHWIEIFMGAPVLLGLAVIVLAWNLYRARKRGEDASVAAGRLIFSIFALVMLTRMILYARIYQYGFVLAATAMMGVGMMLLSWIPDALDRRGRSGWIIKGSAMGMLLAFVLVHLMATRSVLQRQTIDMGWGFRGGGMAGPLLKEAVTELTSRAKPGDTLAAFPASPWVNFVSGLPNPTPYELLDPLGFIRAGGEAPVLAAYQANPPTWVLLVHQDTSEYGAGLFGLDFAHGLGAWIDENYERVALFGAPPLKSRAFGIALLRHRTDHLPP